MEENKKKRGLTKEEIVRFKKLYPNMTRGELMDIFGISEKKIENYAFRLHLYKTEEYIIKIKRKGAEAAYKKRIANNKKQHNNG